MKAERHLVFIVVLTLIFCCSLLLVACSSVTGAIGNGTVASQANCATSESLVASGGDADLGSGGTVASQSECATAENLALASTQSATTVSKSNSKKAAATSSSSPTRTGIYLGGGEITSNRSYGGGWRYYFDSNTLLLNGYYSATSLDSTLGLTKELFPNFNGKSSQAHLAIDSSVCSSLTIKVVGENLSHFGDLDDTDDYDKDGYNYYGIYAPGVDLIMDIEDDYAPMKYNPVYYPLEIYTHRDAVYCKNLTLKGGGGLRADSCIGSGINCQSLSVTKNRLITYTQHGNNIYHGTVGHTTAAILVSGSVTFDGAYAEVYVRNTAPKVGSVWAAYQIDVYGIKAGSLNIKGGARVNVDMSFSTDVTPNVDFNATGIYASSCTSYNGGKLHTKISTNASVPDTASLYGCNIEDYTYFLGGDTTIEGELFRNGSQSFKLESNMQNYPLPFGTMSTSIEDTKYKYTANISALYLRNDNGTLQYARNIFFNDAITLSSNEIDMADFADVSSNNVYSVSGDWKIKLIAGDNTSSFVALGGSISLEMSGGNTYDTLNLYTYSGATIYLNGDGIVNLLNANGCNDVGVQRFASYGLVNFRGGTVKKGSINSGCDVIFYDGNINVDYKDELSSKPYRKWTFDFGEYADLVSFQTDLTFSDNSSDRIGIYPIDGKLYFWDAWQTSSKFYRQFKYAVVRQAESYTYYLYPKAADAEGTFTMQRLAETDVFVFDSNLYSKYYLADGDTLALSAGTFAKQVTRPATTLGGSSSTEILPDSTTTTIPDGFTVLWTRTDKNGKTTQIGTGLSLSVQLKALDDDGSVYTCSILQGNTQKDKFETSIFVFDYNSLGLAPQKASADEIKSFSFSFDDFKGYNDWIATNYNFIWQKKDGSGAFEDIAGTENQKTLSIAVESDDSYKAQYRVRCYSNKFYVEGMVMKSYPTYYTITTNLTFRELPSFSGKLSVSPTDNHAGVTKYYSISLNNCYEGVVSCWYEYSTDDGQTWQRALNNPAFENGIDINFQSIYLSPYGKTVTDSWYGSKAVNVFFSTEMNGWKLRCVMQSGDYVVYSNEATLTVLDFAGFTVQPQSNVVITSSDSLSLTAAFEEDYTDEDGNGISDVTYQWLYETWSNGNYEKVNTTNNITETTLYYENASGIGSVSRYRLQVNFTYNGTSYTRYSDYAYVYILYPPAFDDGGVVISDMADGIHAEGDSVSWTVNDNGVNFHYYKTYQFEVSKDGGDTWQSVGEAFTQSYKNTTFKFDLQNLSVADGGLYRCKVSIEKNEVTVCSYSNVVSLGVAVLPSVDDSQGYAATSTGKAILSVKHEYSSNLSVTYQWEGYDSTLGWTALTGENYFDTDLQAMYMFGVSLPSYEKYRCVVNYKLSDDITVIISTNEVAPVLVVAPTITAEPIDRTVWLGEAAKFMLWISNSTENYTVLWEISNDEGKSWKNAVDIIQCESGETDYSLLCNTTTYDMDGAMFRCTVTNAIGDVFESVVTEPVTLTVRSGYVSSEQELLDALQNGMTEFKLLGDVSLTSTLVVDRDITLDLNGHVLEYQSDVALGSVIKVTGNATLTLIDSAPNAEHANANLPRGGVIRRGVVITLDVDEGSIFGGGISLESGTLVFIGGTIYDCYATYGGGIYVSDSSRLSMEGGVIDSCGATEGGGIYAESDIDIKDGSITNCTSSGTEGGGKSDALYLDGATLNASGGTVDGTVHLKKSAVVTPVGSATTTTFKRSVSCDDSAINGGFYLSDVEGANTSGSFTVTYMNGDQVVTKLVVELGQKAIAVSLPTDGKLYIWYNGDVAYDFDELVNEDLTLQAKWYVTAEVADDLTDKLDKTQNELDKTKSELSETKSELSETQSKLDETKTELGETKNKLDETKSELDQTQSKLDETKSELSETKSELSETKSELSETQSKLDETRNEVAQAQSEIDSLNGNLSGATEDIDELNDKLSSVTAWMIVSIVLFGSSCGAIVPLLIFFLRKKGIIK